MEEEQLLKNLAKLKEYYSLPQHKRMVEVWEKTTRTAILRSDAYKFDAIKDLVKNLKNKIEKINVLLTNDRELDDKNRDRLFEERDAYKFLISFFEQPEKSLQGIKKKVKEELK